MFSTRFVIPCSATVLLLCTSGCLNHTRVLYQPRPFKTATVPVKPMDDAGVERPAVTPPTTNAPAGLVPPSQ